MSNIEIILANRRKEILDTPSLETRYENLLLNAFPLEIPAEELFHPNTFTDEDEIDYYKSVAIFSGKKWHEVDFQILYHSHSQFLMLSLCGKYYYLPAFLKNFYNLKYFNIEFFTYFLGDLHSGFNVPKIDCNEKSLDYKSFEKIDPIQSKLVAMFLVNVANLMPEGSHEASQAQRALTNYWGNFLLF